MAASKDNKTLSFTIRNDSNLDFKQNGSENISGRFANLLCNFCHSDMAFYVEQDDVTIPAHKMIVGMASDVLYAMLHGTGSIAGAANSILTVQDCSADDFYQVLRHLYIGDTNALNASNAATILKAAHYYDLKILEKKCSDFMLDKTLSVQNVCQTFNTLHLMDIPLSNECLIIIQKSADQLLTNPKNSIFDMDMTALDQVFKMDWLGIKSEVEVFKGLLLWARQTTNNTTTAMIRQVVESRLDYVRFSAMTLAEFAQCLQLTTPPIFTTAEIGATVLRISTGSASDDICLTHHTRSRTRH